MPLKSWFSGLVYRFRRSAELRQIQVPHGQWVRDTDISKQKVESPERSEIEPPWIEYPGYGPADMFWRQTGEAYFLSVWQPFYQALSEVEQQLYLQRWSVPDEWRDFYFDQGWQEWLRSTDEAADTE